MTLIRLKILVGSIISSLDGKIENITQTSKFFAPKDSLFSIKSLLEDPISVAHQKIRAKIEIIKCLEPLNPNCNLPESFIRFKRN